MAPRMNVSTPPDGGVPRLVVVLGRLGQEDDTAWTTLADALSPFGAVHLADRLAVLLTFAPEADLVIVPGIATPAGTPESVISRLREVEASHIALRVPPTSATGVGIVRGIRAGGDGVLLGTGPSLAEAARRLGQRLLDRIQASAIPDDELDPLAAKLLRFAVAAGDRIARVADLAGAVGLSTRTLERRCRASGWPAPRGLLSWGRACAAALRAESERPRAGLSIPRRLHGVVRCSGPADHLDRPSAFPPGGQLMLAQLLREFPSLRRMSAITLASRAADQSHR